MVRLAQAATEGGTGGVADAAEVAGKTRLEDSLCTFRVFEEAADLPDVSIDLNGDNDDEVHKARAETAPAVALTPGWQEQGVVVRNGALWCSLCNKGPMLRMDALETHLASKLHRLKTRPERSEAPKRPGPAKPPERSVAAEVTPELAERGIVRGGEAGHRATQAEYLCSLCDAGPFQCLVAAAVHVKGRSHQKLERKKEVEAAIETRALPAELEAAGGEVTDDGLFRCTFCLSAGPFADLVTLRQHLSSKWHVKFSGLSGTSAPASDDDAPPDILGSLPAYVTERPEGAFYCELCACKAAGLGAMQRHLVGERHIFSCQRSGHPELKFVKERDRLEELRTGRAVKRSDTYLRQWAHSGLCGKHPDDDLNAPSGGAPERGGVDDAGLGPREVLLPGDLAEAATAVVPPAPGWVWDTSTCLSVAAGETVQVLAVEDGWAYGRASLGAGWLPLAALRCAPGPAARQPGRPAAQASRRGAEPAAPDRAAGDAPEQRRHAPKPGRVLLARGSAAGPPPEWVWDPSGYLLPSAGDEVEVLVVEDGWAYCHSHGQHGWLHPDDLCGGEDGPAAEPGAADAPRLRAPPLRRADEQHTGLTKAEFAELLRMTA